VEFGSLISLSSYFNFFLGKIVERLYVKNKEISKKFFYKFPHIKLMIKNFNYKKQENMIELMF